MMLQFIALLFISTVLAVKWEKSERGFLVTGKDKQHYSFCTKYGSEEHDYWMDQRIFMRPPVSVEFKSDGDTVTDDGVTVGRWCCAENDPKKFTKTCNLSTLED